MPKINMSWKAFKRTCDIIDNITCEICDDIEKEFNDDVSHYHIWFPYFKNGKCDIAGIRAFHYDEKTNSVEVEITDEIYLAVLDIVKENMEDIGDISSLVYHMLEYIKKVFKTSRLSEIPVDLFASMFSQGKYALNFCKKMYNRFITSFEEQYDEIYKKAHLSDLANGVYDFDESDFDNDEHEDNEIKAHEDSGHQSSETPVEKDIVKNKVPPKTSVKQANRTGSKTKI